MISKQAVLDLIDDFGFSVHTPMDQRKALKQLINAIPSISDGWISVEDGLPNNKQAVITLNSAGQVIPCNYEYGEFERYFDKCDQDRILVLTYNDITHWQPLPQKPTK